MSHERIEDYVVDQNSLGELLFLLPDRGALPDGAWFSLQGDLLSLTFADGEGIELPSIPPSLHKTLRHAPKILVAETAEGQALRCYEAQRQGRA